jgi:hypothetical protein
MRRLELLLVDIGILGVVITDSAKRRSIRNLVCWVII